MDFNIHDFVIKIVEKYTGIGELPKENDLKNNINNLDKEINNILKEKCVDSDYISNLYNKLRILDDTLTLRRRIDTSVTTLIYLVYTIAGSIVGISLGIGVFFTTTGTLGHILLSLSILGSVVSITIGIKSALDERSYILFLFQNIKGRV